ncbi:MAG: hypothetical protein FJ206_00600 [Gemmatimonadetes bacterium]|nr:hypothetical protein [Gemmatimonadota bacterium]
MIAHLILLGAFQGGLTTPPEYRGTDRALRVVPPRVEASIQVDGVLDEPVWTSAARLTGFSQYSPADGRPSEEGTEVLVWYSPTAIHFGVRASAEPGSVRAHLADRDKGIQSDDNVELHLGTFNDGRQALVFEVNPLGVQADGALVEGATRRYAYGQNASQSSREATDLNPDFTFESKGRLVEGGYEVEVRIPFKSLRYQAADRQDWSLQIVRRSAASGREDTWAPAQRAATSFVRQSGTLVGLEGLRRGRVLEVTPIMTSTVSGAPLAGGWDYRGGTPEIGGNVKWAPSSNLAFNGTANPDFSQIESDAGQIASDPRRALYFAEKRPFFLDGLEYFTTPSQVIYTRRIASPIGAAKVTGRLAGASFGLLSAVDDQSVSASGRHRPLVNLFRIQGAIGAQSRLGAAYTDRIDGGDYNRVGEVDGRLALGPLTNLSFFGAMSRTRANGATQTAPMGYLELRHTGHTFGLQATVNAVSDQFRAASGFIMEPDIVQFGITPSLTWYGRRGGFVERFTALVYADLVWAYPDFRAKHNARDRRATPRLNWTLRGGWEVGLTGYRFSYGYDERLYRGYAIEVPTATGSDTIPYPRGQRIPSLAGAASIRSPEIAGFQLQSYLAFGRDLNYAEWSPGNIRLGKVSLGYRPTPKLRVESSMPFQAYYRASDGSFVSRRILPRLKVEYQMSRAVFLRAVGEYRAFRQDSLRDDTRTNAPILIGDGVGGYRRDRALAMERNDFRMDFLFSYQPTPGTVLFAGYGSSLNEPDAFRFQGLSRVEDNFFLKWSYLFRL